MLSMIDSSSAAIPNMVAHEDLTPEEESRKFFRELQSRHSDYRLDRAMDSFANLVGRDYFKVSLEALFVSLYSGDELEILWLSGVSPVLEEFASYNSFVNNSFPIIRRKKTLDNFLSLPILHQREIILDKREHKELDSLEAYIFAFQKTLEFNVSSKYKPEKTVLFDEDFHNFQNNESTKMSDELFDICSEYDAKKSKFHFPIMRNIIFRLQCIYEEDNLIEIFSRAKDEMPNIGVRDICKLVENYKNVKNLPLPWAVEMCEGSNVLYD